MISNSIQHVSHVAAVSLCREGSRWRVGRGQLTGYPPCTDVQISTECRRVEPSCTALRALLKERISHMLSRKSMTLAFSGLATQRRLVSEPPRSVCRKLSTHLPQVLNRSPSAESIRGSRGRSEPTHRNRSRSCRRRMARNPSSHDSP